MVGWQTAQALESLVQSASQSGPGATVNSNRPQLSDSAAAGYTVPKYLAGSEAAFQAAQAGAQVVLHEMRPVRPTFAHQTEGLAELVCSNSFRSDDWQNNAVGLLHEEMRRAGSLIMAKADAHKLPAGGALAVDRHGFSAAVTAVLAGHPRITIRREEITGYLSE